MTASPSPEPTESSAAVETPSAASVEPSIPEPSPSLSLQLDPLVALLDRNIRATSLANAKASITAAFAADPGLATAPVPASATSISDTSFRRLALESVRDCGRFGKTSDEQRIEANCTRSFQSLACAYRIYHEDVFRTATKRLLGYIEAANPSRYVQSFLNSLRDWWTAKDPDGLLLACNGANYTPD